MSQYLESKLGYRIAVVGATGAVGQAMLEILAEKNFPISELTLIASSKSAGSTISFKNKDYVVQDVEQYDPTGLDIALFSAGGSASLKYAPIFADAGCYVIDNSSTWRMHDDVALIVPEVNPDAMEVAKKNRIIANPNCSTIQMVVALKPLHDAVPIQRVVVSTYQAVSGAGGQGIEELSKQTQALMACKEVESNVFSSRIAFNVIPHIDVFLNDGYTKEEQKMILETKKIMQADIAVTATTVRVPVFYGHSESVNITFTNHLGADQARTILADAAGIAVVDDPAGEDYPTAIEAAGNDSVWVGRIRDDLSCDNSLHLWVVADNVRKGAALNAVQIAEILIAS